MNKLIGPALAAIFLLSACSLTRQGDEPGPSIGLGGPVRSVTAAGEIGETMQIDVFDDTFALRDVRKATDGELAAAMKRIPDKGIAALGVIGDPASVVVAWIGLPCDEYGTLTVSPGIQQIVLAPGPVPGACDAMAVGRAVVLTFGAAVDATRIDMQLGRTRVDE